MTPFLPHTIQCMTDRLTADTGQAPTITRTSPLHYHLELANERVTLTITWRRNPAGKWKWKNSTLAIDGKQRAIAKDYDDFIRIWNTPNEADAKPTPTVLPALTPVPDTEELPSEITAVRDAVTNRTRNTEDATVYIARTDRGYTLVADSSKGHVRIHYVTRRNGNTWWLDPHQPFQVLDEDRVDKTIEFAGDLQAALAHVFGTSVPLPAGSPKAGGPRAAAVSNSVTVRRATVIRV